jgi:hypothetical protein
MMGVGSVEFSNMPNWTDSVTAIAAMAAVSVGGFAWFTALETLRDSYRPVLRPVPLWRPGARISLNSLELRLNLLWR